MKPDDRLKAIVGLLMVFAIAYGIVLESPFARVIGIAVERTAGDSLLVKALAATSNEEKMGHLQKYNQYAVAIPNPSDRFHAIQTLYASRSSFDPIFSDYLPKKINWETHAIEWKHNHLATPTHSTEDAFFIVKKGADEWGDDQPIPLLLTGNMETLPSIPDPQAFILNGIAYLDLPTTETDSTGELESKSAELPYNHTTRRMLIIVPYNNTGPLHPNYLSIATTLGNANREYYLSNSEGKLIIDYDVVPVLVSTTAFDASTTYTSVEFTDIIMEADPLIDYSPYDFAMVLALTDNWDYGGAGIKYDVATQQPGYYATNEPLEGIQIVSYINVSSGVLTPYQYSIFQHEIGHILTYWSPHFDFSHYSGAIPHANGVHFPTCTSTTVACNSIEYGNHYDVMGLGNGLFNQHTAVYRAGLRSPTTVQKVTASGTYELCAITNSPSPPGDSCPRELLIPIENGLDLAIEFRSPIFPDSILVDSLGCSPSQFEGLLLYGANPQYGSTFAGIPVNANGEVVLSTTHDTITCAGGKTIYQYPLTLGKWFTMAQGGDGATADISLSSIRVINPQTGDRMARVIINYYPASCTIAQSTKGGVSPTEACPTVTP